MTGSVALDVVIGLIFIYLLYSLLATIICEIIATNLGLRARNLHITVLRMLEDSAVTQEYKIIAYFRNLIFSFKRFFVNKDGPAGCAFFQLPGIKYLAKNSLFSKPSYITKETFSKAMMELFRRFGKENLSDLENVNKVLSGDVNYSEGLKNVRKVTDLTPTPPSTIIDYTVLKDKIKASIESVERSEISLVEKKLINKIESILNSKKNDKTIVYKIDEYLHLFGNETRSHLKSLMKEAKNDLIQFKALLEQWFQDTMERSTGWYKKRIQFILLLIGLVIASVFNVNTFEIVEILANDKDTRDKLVDMASNYVTERGELIAAIREDDAQSVVDSCDLGTQINAELDSLLNIKEQLEADIDKANLLMGFQPTDSIPITEWFIMNSNQAKPWAKEPAMNERLIIKGDTAFLVPFANEYLAQKTNQYYHITSDSIKANDGKKSNVFYASFNRSRFLLNNLLGYIITAIAISLGAPFWFDLLSKLMKLRGSVKEPLHTESQKN